ncbi:GNAT family N-acetyltransferase [Actinomycetes bacterium M1A6_2h]
MTSSVMTGSSSALSSDVLVTDRRYSLVVSTDRHHRVAAQRLRAEVFRSEPGFRLPTGIDLDADRFDDFCDHVLVREDETGDFVGCYRMLPPGAAAAAGGYYTATEFDITELDATNNRTVEMGRACVRSDHRSGSVLGLMWSGILRYLDLTGHDAVMGCVSVPMDSGDGEAVGAHVRGVRDLLMTRHASSYRAYPIDPVVVDGVSLDGIAASAKPLLPPLLRGYLRLGATFCGEPALDPDFGVADFVSLLRVSDANVRYLDRLRSAAAYMESTRA